MIFRDLYACPQEDFHRALTASSQSLLRRGVVESPAAIEPADLEALLAHPDFDPSLSLLAYDSGQPVAFLLSRLAARGEEREAVWSLFGSRPEAARAREMLLDEALGHWRQAGARRVRQGRLGLHHSEPRLDRDADLVELLQARGFEITAENVLLVFDLKKLATAEGAAERERDLRQKGYFVREAHPTEVALVARQYHPRRTATLDLDLWNQFIRAARPEALLVGEHRRQVCGYIGFYGWTLGRERPALGPSYVDEVHRASGIGTLLHHAALTQAKQAGKAQVEMHGPAALARQYEKAAHVEARFLAASVATLD
jgi:GNAT superfamily N-acetyltransferase